jgi:opacity protein-like surface antigen
MKLANVTRNAAGKLTGIKSKAVRMLAAATLAGAVLAAAAPAAEAQRVIVGVGIGGPRYYAPLPPHRFYPYPAYGYGYGPYYGYGWRGHEEFRFHHDPYRRW